MRFNMNMQFIVISQRARAHLPIGLARVQYELAILDARCVEPIIAFAEFVARETPLLEY